MTLVEIRGVTPQHIAWLQQTNQCVQALYKEMGHFDWGEGSKKRVTQYA